MRPFPLLLLPALLSAAASALGAQQATGTVEGRARDEEGAAVFAATVVLSEGERIVAGVDTDRLGFFRLAGIAPGTYTLRATRLGHTGAVREGVAVAGGAVTAADVTLPRAAVSIAGVAVEATRSRERERFDELAGVTVREMSLEDLKSVPGVAEADPLRAVEVLPGVVSTSDFSSAFHVRGGSADQNLILVDGVPVFSPFHLGGFFSVFNADMVRRAELHSGGFAAEHGGRVSSVLLVESDPGDGRFAVDGGVSVLATRLAVAGGAHDLEGLGLATLRARAGARRSYFDVLLKPVFDFPYHLTDVQGVVEAWTTGGDRLRLTGYTGDDVLDLRSLDAEDFPLRVDWTWGNDLVGGSWTRPRRGGGALELSGGVTRYGTRLLFPDFADTDFRSRIAQAYVHADVDARPWATWWAKGGVALERFAYHNRAVSGGTEFGRGDGTGWLTGAYGQLAWRPPRWRVELGARLDGWHPDPGAASWRLAPRVAAKRFLGGGDVAVKVAAGRYTQFLHSLRDEELPLGLDIWVLAGERARPVVSDQVQIGVERFFGDRWFAALEAYGRSYDGVVSFNPADDPNDRLDDILAGDGTSVGWDLFVRREEGHGPSGWVALSWLRARRTFPDALQAADPPPDVTYPPVFDRRWDVDVVVRLPLPDRWSGGVRLNVGSGTPFTRPVGSYAYYSPRQPLEGGRLWWQGTSEDGDALGGFAVALGERNGERYPAYHRLDVSLRRDFSPSWGRVTATLDVLNVYNRRNVLFYFYQYQETPPVRSGISMFPLLPTVGVEIAF